MLLYSQVGDNMNLRKVKGILIDKDGLEHPFGIHKNSKVNDLGEDNYHDSSFAKDILPTEWFKSLNYNYTEETIHKQAINLAALGIILNLSGLAAGAATIGCCCNMVGRARTSLP